MPFALTVTLPPSATEYGPPAETVGGWFGLVALPVEPSERRHIYNQFVIRTDDRDALRRHLDRAGIGSEVYYPVPFHLQPCFASLGYRRGDFPQAEAASRDSLAIPIYGEMTSAQQRAVVGAIADFVHRPVGMVKSAAAITET